MRTCYNSYSSPTWRILRWWKQSGVKTSVIKRHSLLCLEAKSGCTSVVDSITILVIKSQTKSILKLYRWLNYNKKRQNYKWCYCGALFSLCWWHLYCSIQSIANSFIAFSWSMPLNKWDTVCDLSDYSWLQQSDETNMRSEENPAGKAVLYLGWITAMPLMTAV